MALKKKSVERILSNFAGIELSVINQIQSAYIRKNPEKIRELLNKPKLSDSSALGQGRLASRYVDIVSEPTKTVQIISEKKFGIKLDKNGSKNLTNMANYGISQQLTPVIPQQPIKQLSLPKSPLHSLFPISNYVQKNYCEQLLINNPTSNNLHEIINMLNNKEMQLRQMGFTKFRCYLKLEVRENMNGIIVSSPVLNIGNWMMVSQFFDEYCELQQITSTQQLITEKGYKYERYNYAEFENFSYTFSNVIAVWVNFYK